MTLSAACATRTHFRRCRSTNKERDTETGNDYFLARYYSSSVGRFLSPDWSASVEPVPYAKLGDPQSLNLYAYVENRPISQADPGGHEGCTLENAGPADCGSLSRLQQGGAAAVDNRSEGENLTNALGSYREQVAEQAQQQNPGIEYVDQFSGQHHASVSLYQDAAGHFGHMGIGIDANTTEGFSTHDPHEKIILRAFWFPSARLESDQAMHAADARVSYLNIPISDASYQAMRTAISNREENPGRYNLIFRNCSDFVEDVLHAGNVPGVPHNEIFIPKLVWSMLQAR
jgi:RHS repeat-associated protein